MKGPVLFIIIFSFIIILALVAIKIFQLKQHRLLTRIGVFKFIDKIILIFSIIGILVTILWDFNYIRYKPAIQYKDWETITLNDFRGLKRPFITLDGESKFAYVSTSILITRKKDKIEIKSLFHPCRSYVYNRKLFADGLLTHEIYHFNITEYCARLMRKDIIESIKDSTPIYINDLRLKYLTRECELQYLYDDETNHSYVHGKQLEWQERVDSLLKSLDDYSNTIISLKK